MAEEYILLKDLNKAAKEFDLDKTTMNIISIELPTHSFEWVEEWDKIRDDFYKLFVDKCVPHGGNGDNWHGEEGVEYDDFFKEELNPHTVFNWFKDYICQHFKKAEEMK